MMHPVIARFRRLNVWGRIEVLEFTLKGYSPRCCRSPFNGINWSGQICIGEIEPLEKGGGGRVAIERRQAREIRAVLDWLLLVAEGTKTRQRIQAIEHPIRSDMLIEIPTWPNTGIDRALVPILADME